ncbi:crossover junction endodeoxyribonuclease RuvC [Thermoactinomyces sp. DSM 45892]|uniref:crossover junction endodeoxyribonuclease RuvC n=1 Tax=Thermoactinomyces sp. DSM 45892 TaxID=1882753 RepID=UPI000897AD84|nr:crossover junction endodeoxyribonuclease RuvC [Thermoactinomyces sp. DSM 45892]SDY03643.1 Holliday junction endonuclease RuvC [Thermoactinomyces sp. DSM 45892]
MRIMGIDPGYALVGYGVIDQKSGRLEAVDYGAIQTEPHYSIPTRMKQVYDAMKVLLNRFQPEVVAIEKLFFNKNVTNALLVVQARGVIILAVEEAGIPITEYTPSQVKLGAVGYGKAEKRQVQEMVKVLLRLSKVPKPDDVADALAIAICEAHSSKSISQVGRGGIS